MTEPREPRRCRKCGSEAVTIKWEPDDDILQCTCDECDFPWDEPPLDKIEAQLLKVKEELGLAPTE